VEDRIYSLFEKDEACCRSRLDIISIILGYDVSSLGSWFPTFRDDIVVSTAKAEILVLFNIMPFILSS